MDTISAAQGFSAMGSESRLELVRALVRAGNGGLSVGELQNRTGLPGSTLNHHLSFLSAADLVVQDKQGRKIISRANFEHLEELAKFILEECCSQPEGA